MIKNRLHGRDRTPSQRLHIAPGGNYALIVKQPDAWKKSFKPKPELIPVAIFRV